MHLVELKLLAIQYRGCQDFVLQPANREFLAWPTIAMEVGGAAFAGKGAWDLPILFHDV